MKINDLTINPKTLSQLEHYLSSPAHALLLVGAKGFGSGTIAQTVAKQIGGPSVSIIRPTIHSKQKTAVINVQDIREIYNLNGKHRNDKLVIVIDGIDHMTNDSPEAALKLLEEPSENVLFILTAHETSGVPKTILSRVQSIMVLAPTAEACNVLIQNSSVKMTNDKIRKISFIASNKPAEIRRLLDDELYFRTIAESVEKAKRFLEGDYIERLKTVASVSERTEAVGFVENLAKIITVTSKNSSNINSIPAKMEILSEVIDNIKQNGNIRTQLTYLALNI